MAQQGRVQDSTHTSHTTGRLAYNHQLLNGAGFWKELMSPACPGRMSVTCSLTRCTLGWVTPFSGPRDLCVAMQQAPPLLWLRLPVPLAISGQGLGTNLGSSSLGFMLGSSRPWPAGRSSCSLSVTISKVISSLPCGDKGEPGQGHKGSALWLGEEPGQDRGQGHFMIFFEKW